MAITETIKSSAYRVWSTALGHWKKYSLWNLAKDTEFDDGNNAETKVGAINGITDSLVANDSSVAASSAAVYELNKNLSALNGDGAISGIEVKEDGAYITYTLPGGADPVVKKLGSADIYIPKWVVQMNGLNSTLDFDVTEYTKISIENSNLVAYSSARQNIQGSNDLEDWETIYELTDTGIVPETDISAWKYIRIFSSFATAVSFTVTGIRIYS